ncbi:MAG: hypothetical protein SGPRY_010152, partial [Prymnesium sp.]
VIQEEAQLKELQSCADTASREHEKRVSAASRDTDRLREMFGRIESHSANGYAEVFKAAGIESERATQVR